MHAVAVVNALGRPPPPSVALPLPLPLPAVVAAVAVVAVVAVVAAVTVRGLRRFVIGRMRMPPPQVPYLPLRRRVQIRPNTILQL